MRITVLVMEDSASIQEVVRLMLEGHGYTVHTTESTNEAIDIVKRVKPEVVLLDYCLPGLTPSAFVKIARSEKPDICIILMSGISDVSAKAKSLGLSFAIQKPFELTALLALIEKAISSKN